jgi:hypothetical protein
VLRGELAVREVEGITSQVSGVGGMSSVKEAAVINQSVAHETIQTTPQGTKRPPYFPRAVGATTAWVTKPTVSTPT